MKPITNIKIQRKDVIKNFILVTILSTGVSLVANAITKDMDMVIALIPGIVCVLFVAICYIVEYLGYSSYETKADTILVVDDEKNTIPIDRFGYSEDLNRAVVSILSENKAYKTIWNDAFAWGKDEGVKGRGFVGEFMDYLFINWLSLELDTYFTEIRDGETELIGREQMPEVLIKNRVIELITKPYEEREKFLNKMDKDDTDAGTVVYVEGEDDVVYDMLEIELPRKSKVYRKGNSLVVSNRNFDIRFESEYEGYGSVLPRYFEEFYMNRQIENTHSYLVKVKMTIKLKPFFLFSVRDWKYLGWLDCLGDGFVKYFSLDEFISSIGYEQAATNHILFLNGFGKNEDEDKKKYDDIRIVKVEERDNSRDS